MRTFGKDAPEFMAFKVDGDDGVYKLPLAGSIKAAYNVRLFKASSAPTRFEQEALLQELMLDMFADYLGEEFAAGLTADQMLEIFEAWREESAKANQDPGE